MFVAITFGSAYVTVKNLDTARSFLDPTLMHFVQVLLTACLLVIPSMGPQLLGGVLVAFGVVRLLSLVRIYRHMKQAQADAGDIELSDWLSGIVVPFVAHLGLAGSGVAFLARQSAFGAVAAVALSTNLMFVSLALTQMLSVGCVALVSQAAGRKDNESVQRLFNQSQCLSLCGGAVFLVLALASMGAYADRLSGDPETAALARSFLAWFIPSLGLQFAIVGLASALRGIGDMRPGLIAQIASVVLNMILAPFLIFGWMTGRAFGVAGAAMSTFVATVAAVVGLMVYLARHSTFLELRFVDWRPDFKVWKKMLGIGLPSGAEFLLMSFTMAVIYGAIRAFGSQAQAGFGIASRVMQAGFMPAVAISVSVAAVAGQNFGAREHARVRETAIESAKITIAFMAFFTLRQLGAAGMIRRFSQDPPVVDVGADCLRTASYNYVASGLVFVIAGILQGVDHAHRRIASCPLERPLRLAPKKGQREVEVASNGQECSRRVSTVGRRLRCPHHDHGPYAKGICPCRIADRSGRSRAVQSARADGCASASRGTGLGDREAHRDGRASTIFT